MFKNLMIALALTAAAAASALAAETKPAAATNASPAKSAQQKVVQCNKDAAGKKGDERKAFMKGCLSRKG
jgi:hypothetical protein